MSRTRIATTVAAAVVLLAGCSAPGPGRETDDDGRAGARVAADGAPDEAQAGTRENPLPPGTTFEFGKQWGVTFEPTNRDATETLINGDDFMREVVTERLPAGSVPVLVPFRLTFLGDGSGHPWDLRVEFVGGGGNTHRTGCPGSHEQDYVLAGEMFSGAEAEVTACVVLPEDRVDGGMWLVEGPQESLADRERVFIGLGQP